MIHAIRENWALFLGMALLMAANGLLSTLLTLRGAEIGFSESVIGLMQAGYPLGALIGCRLAPKMVEHVGHVRAFGALASLCSTAAIVHLLTADAWVWGAMRLLAGFCFPGLYVISESWLNAKSANAGRASVLSLYFIVQIFGAAAGQRLAGLDDPSGDALFGLTSILISLSLVPLLMSRNPAPPYVAPERLPLLDLARISPTAVVGAVLNGAAQAAFYIATPLYALSLGLTANQATGMLVIATLAGAMAQFPLGWISDRVDRRWVIALASLAGAALSATSAFGAFSLDPTLSMAAIAATTLPIYAICVAHANDQLRPAQIVPASGALVFALNIGILFGAFAGPAVIGAFGAPGFPAFLGLIAALTAAIALARRARKSAPENSTPAAPIAVQGVQSAPRRLLADRQGETRAKRKDPGADPA